VNELRSIRQGGMGVYTSDWYLSKTVSKLGGFGTISGVELGRVMARILQRGDPGGHFKRALSHFPFPDVAEEVFNAFYVEGGIPEDKPFKTVPMFTINPSNFLINLTICANFAFVWLAKEGHNNPITINYLTRIAMPHIYAITGAMLGNVDYITMGAGIPDQISRVILAITEGRDVKYRVPVIGKNIAHYEMSFNPDDYFGKYLPLQKRPGFIPIVGSNALASFFADEKRFPRGSIDGLAVVKWTTGGHHSLPRKNQPTYGELDEVDYFKIAKLGLPFWIGGSCASPEKLAWAQSVGATGIQVASIFALCDESKLDPELKRIARKLGYEGTLRIRIDMRISSTGFPFKIAELEGTISEEEVYKNRCRKCNIGALVSLYEKPDGTIGYRCPSEPVEEGYVRKGGKIEDTVGRGCLCNFLMSTVKLGNRGEPPGVTLGIDYSFLNKLMKNAGGTYTAEDAMNYLLSR
jgi:NAD(P)H-dependent flavin oxidoreductase YrpB (nitropropane dioxygenase family)